MSGRLVPFAAVLLLFALMPFLGGSAAKPPTTSVVLAAGSPAAVQDAVQAVGQARDQLSGLDAPAAVDAAPAGSSLASSIGGGLFLFPAISLSPVDAAALMAPLTGVPFFIHPVPGGETSPFGPRIHPLLGRPMFHTGIDLAAACGTPIHAAADGTVIYARVSASWGGRTIIQHSPTVKTAYGHQSKFLVTEGQKVKQGQVIGLSGTTGWSTGCHLHFDVIINDRYVDPAPYLGFPPSASASVPYAAVPHLVLDPGGSGFQTVEDGDVPLTEASETPVAPAPDEADLSSTPAGAKPPAAPKPPTATRPPTTRTAPSPTTSTAAPSPTTTKPSPTSSTPPDTTTTSTPPTTTPPTTTPPTTTPPTSSSATTTTSSTTTSPSTTAATTDTAAAKANTDPTGTPAPPSSATPTPTATATVTATATQVLKTAAQVAAATESATCSPTSSGQSGSGSQTDPTCVDPSTEPKSSTTAGSGG